MPYICTTPPGPPAHLTSPHTTAKAIPHTGRYIPAEESKGRKEWFFMLQDGRKTCCCCSLLYIVMISKWAEAGSGGQWLAVAGDRQGTVGGHCSRI